jgi:hypothetical protein
VNTTGTCHFTAFAVEAEFQRLVKVGWILQAITLTVWTGLLGTGIVGRYGSDRADSSANAALGALLKVVFAEVACLHSFSHNN